MAFVRADMEPILQQYAGFGYLIYYLYQQQKIECSDIANIFLRMNPEIAALRLNKVLRQLDLEDLPKAFSTCSDAYPKQQCLLDYFGLDGDRIEIKDDVYETVLNYEYTNRMLKNLSHTKRHDLKDARILGCYQELLKEMVEKTKSTVLWNADQPVRSKAG